MDASMLNAEQYPPRLKVSVTARLVACLSYTIPLIGGALSSFLLIRMFEALRANESAGISAVMAAIKEARVPVIVSLYLAAICGIAVIVVLVVRMVVETKTASPPFWFFAIGGGLCLVPAGLFWKSELMILEVLSPGSSISSGGIGGVAADISQLLWLSIIAAPIIFLLLLAASVFPLSSRSGKKWGSLFSATAVEILLIATVVAIPFFINEPKRKKEIVNLPVNVKDADADRDIERESSMILILTSDNKLYLEQKLEVGNKVERTEKIISREELPEKLKKFSETKSPDKQIVYFKADANAAYENVLQVFDIIRKAEISKVGLVVIGEKKESDPYQIYSSRFEVKLPELPNNANQVVKPNPLTLVAILRTDGVLTLNSEGIGMISDSQKLVIKLTSVFKDREDGGVLREGTNEVEKTVFLKVSKSAKYGDFIKLVEAVKLAGAQPIAIQFDDVNTILETVY